jgi:hypothetical protein
MAGALAVPPEFSGNVLTVPNVGRPGTNGTLYFSLRDDPKTVQSMTLPVVAGASLPGGQNPDMNPTQQPVTQVPAAAAGAKDTPEPAPAANGPGNK